MVFQLASFFTDIIAQSGYAGLFLLIAGESALMPIPSEIVLPFAGYLIFTGAMSFWLAVFVAIVGQMFGSVIAYYAGKYGGRPFVLNYGKYFFLGRKHFEHVEGWFHKHKHSEAMLFFSRLLPVVRTVISFVVGTAKVPFRKFLLYSTLGIIPWTILLIYIGFKLGDGWQSIIETFDKFQLVVIASIIIFIVWWIWKEKHETKTSA